MARDITQLPDLAVEGGRVAPVRSRMPVYVDLLPPCNNACPAGENIQEWLRLVMRRKSFGLQATLSDAAKRMFFMASTDLDTFRKFIFESSFLETYEIDEATLAKIKEDDVELMLFSFKYLANTLFGAPGLSIREEKIKAKVQEIKKRQDEAMLEAEKEYEALKAERDRMAQEQEARKAKK